MREFEIRSSMSVDEIEDFLRQRIRPPRSFSWNNLRKQYTGSVQDGKLHFWISFHMGSVHAEGEIVDAIHERVLKVRVRRGKWAGKISLLFGLVLVFRYLPRRDQSFWITAIILTFVVTLVILFVLAGRKVNEASAKAIQDELLCLGTLVTDKPDA